MRKLIAGMKVSVDGKVSGPEGYADWVEAWSDGYDVMSRVDACLLGGGMYSGYERYWSGIQSEPDRPLPQTNKIGDAGRNRMGSFRRRYTTLCIDTHTHRGALAANKIPPKP